MSKCVFAGTFDPFTVGHQSIVAECEKRFEEVFIVIGENPDKSPLFPLSVRLSALKCLYAGNDKIKVVDYAEISDYAEFLKVSGVSVYIRGIRSEKDLSYERAAEKINEKLYPFIKTEYISAADNYKSVSSTSVRKLISEGKDFSSFVPEKAANEYKEYIKKITNKL